MIFNFIPLILARPQNKLSKKCIQLAIALARGCDKQQQKIKSLVARPIKKYIYNHILLAI